MERIRSIGAFYADGLRAGVNHFTVVFIVEMPGCSRATVATIANRGAVEHNV
jgi:hypothetical protein